MLDYTELKEQFDEILKFSQFLDNVETTSILDAWAENKEKYYHLFDKNLIWTDKELKTFKMPESIRQEKIYEFIWSLQRKGWNNLAAFVENNMNDFSQNILSTSYTFKDLNLGENITIPAGIKFIKAFKFFFSPDQKEELNYWQDGASRIIQESEVKGYLCYSIHPFDFLSLSENTYKWRSCHALDGEYRAGNLSYLMDSSTVVCYLVSELDEKYALNNFPPNIRWNSKRWRRLLFFSDDMKMCMAGRPYPYEIQGSLEEIRESKFFKNITQRADICWDYWRNAEVSNLNYDKENVYFLNKTYYPLNGSLISNKKLIKDVEGSTHYNDLLYSSVYKPFYIKQVYSRPWSEISIFHEATDYKTTRFSIGACPTCISCGKNSIERGADTMLCPSCYSECEDCEPYAYCEDCGTSIRDADDCFWVEGNAFCRDCYRNLETVHCSRCGEEIFVENAHYFPNKEDEPYCEYCYCERKQQLKNKEQQDTNQNKILNIDYAPADLSQYSSAPSSTANGTNINFDNFSIALSTLEEILSTNHPYIENTNF